MQNGKGSKPRPIKNWNKYLNNFDSIDWSKKSENTACKSKKSDVECVNYETTTDSSPTSAIGQTCKD